MFILGGWLNFMQEMCFLAFAESHANGRRVAARLTRPFMLMARMLCTPMLSTSSAVNVHSPLWYNFSTLQLAHTSFLPGCCQVGGVCVAHMHACA